MDKFLELAFRNHTRQNEELVKPYEQYFEPVMKFARERLSESACDELEELLMDCYVEALDYAGVLGMELAIGVMNGTIQQVLG